MKYIVNEIQEKVVLKSKGSFFHIFFSLKVIMKPILLCSIVGGRRIFFLVI